MGDTEEATEEATEEVVEEEVEEEEVTAEGEEETAEDGEDKENKKEKKRKGANYITTHPEQFSNFLLYEIKNDYLRANLSQNMNKERRNSLLKNAKKGNKKDLARARQKRAQLCLDAIVSYGPTEYRNCSALALMSASHTFREAICQHRKNVSFGNKEDQPERSHHVMMKLDDAMPQHAIRSILKWAHTGDLQLTAKNFEDIVGVTLFLRIKLLRQMLVKLAREVGIKFIPVPANERTIERRKKMGKKDLPNGLEEPELEEGEEPLPEDAPVVEGKAVLETVKTWGKLTYINEIPGASGKKKQQQKKKAKKEVVEEESQSPKKGRNQSQNRKRGANKQQSQDEPVDAKKARKTPVKRENTRNDNRNDNRNDDRNNFSKGGQNNNNNRGRQHNNNRPTNVYRQNQNPAFQQQQMYQQQPQVVYYQAAYPGAPPPQQYGMPAMHQPPQQAPRHQQGYYGGQ